MLRHTTEIHVGERLRRKREDAGMSVRTLAAKAGFSASFISQVENGQASPSISSLERIASVLGVSLGRFFSTGSPGSPSVVRASERERLTSSWSKAEIEVLSAGDSPFNLESVMITIAPGGRSGKQPYAHPGEELAIVFDGKVQLTLGDKEYRLGRGDSVSFSSDVPHLWENPGPHTVQIIIVSPRFTH
jgi:transcriptional regulator with XRE-family HTH domain